MEHSATRRAVAVLSLAGPLAFMVIVLIQHVVDSTLDPATHEISEYVHGPLGWLMTVGFVAWSLSLLGLATTLAHARKARPVLAALLLASAGLLLTASFATQTSAGRLPDGVSLDATGRLHDIGSGITTLALLAAVLLSLRLPDTARLRRGTTLLLAIALPADVFLLLVGSSVDGVRQRVVVAAACLWHLALASEFLVCSASPPRRSS